jgi:hypothetical protein
MNQRISETITVPPEVRLFAAEMKVEAYLPAVVDLARHHFPGGGPIVELEEDPEVDGLKHVLVTVPAVKLTVVELLTAKDEYHRGLYRLMPAPLVCTLRVKPRLG